MKWRYGIVLTAMLLCVRTECAASSAGPDFNGDGFDDLVVGIPLAGNQKDDDGWGEVLVMYGSVGGVTSQGSKVWHQSRTGLPSEPEESEDFGRAIAWGDFNNDGFDDLVVCMRTEYLNYERVGGAVHVLYGSSSGIKGPGSDYFTGVGFGLPGETEIGFIAIAGDYDDDGFDDVALLATRDEDGGGPEEPTRVVMSFSGTRQGLAGAPVIVEMPPLDFQPATSPFLTSYFSYCGVSGDFNGDGFADLAVGTPFHTVDGQPSAGAVTVMLGSTLGLTAESDTSFHQNTPGVTHVAEADDYFGWALAAGNFNDDEFDDLAIGVPGEDTESANLSDDGLLQVLYGTAEGLSVDGDQVWHKNRGLKGDRGNDEHFGWDVAPGDVNGDGFDDLAVSSPGTRVNGRHPQEQ